ncbi:hypothetical protein [Niveispirillum sp. BGYR6]|uniref:hypothetical protein n=1 Tax=Niveispirillum sp. BGYR6 TaxID=2971249 RepID=UPI0022B9D32C|nr:hypothetical protein [Niveispirillum sp. BGYR6]MDG5495163.1 hypothetical protein [Niveispirillum sp. BGYR6]
MNFWARKILMILGVMVGALLMSFFWVRYPELFFIMPNFIVNLIVDYGAGCCELVADYEFLVVFVFSLIFISIFLFLLLAIMRFIRGK